MDVSQPPTVDSAEGKAIKIPTPTTLETPSVKFNTPLETFKTPSERLETPSEKPETLSEKFETPSEKFDEMNHFSQQQQRHQHQQFSGVTTPQHHYNPFTPFNNDTPIMTPKTNHTTNYGQSPSVLSALRALQSKLESVSVSSSSAQRTLKQLNASRELNASKGISDRLAREREEGEHTRVMRGKIEAEKEEVRRLSVEIARLAERGEAARERREVLRGRVDEEREEVKRLKARADELRKEKEDIEKEEEQARENIRVLEERGMAEKKRWTEVYGEYDDDEYDENDERKREIRDKNIVESVGIVPSTTGKISSVGADLTAGSLKERIVFLVGILSSAEERLGRIRRRRLEGKMFAENVKGINLAIVEGLIRDRSKEGGASLIPRVKKIAESEEGGWEGKKTGTRATRTGAKQKLIQEGTTEQSQPKISAKGNRKLIKKKKQKKISSVYNDSNGDNDGDGIYLLRKRTAGKREGKNTYINNTNRRIRDARGGGSSNSVSSRRAKNMGGGVGGYGGYREVKQVKKSGLDSAWKRRGGSREEHDENGKTYKNNHKHNVSASNMTSNVPFLPAGQKSHTFNVLASVSESFRLNGANDMEYKVATRKGSLVPVLSPPRKGAEGGTLRVRMPVVGLVQDDEDGDGVDEVSAEVDNLSKGAARVAHRSPPQKTSQNANKQSVPNDLMELLSELEEELEDMSNAYVSTVASDTSDPQQISTSEGDTKGEIPKMSEDIKRKEHQVEVLRGIVRNKNKAKAPIK